MKILLIGGTGMVGSRILAEAQSRGHDVTAVSRHGERRLDANDTEALRAALTGQDALVVALGPSRTDQDAPRLVDTYRRILDAVRGSGVRVLFVGGAGSLFAAPGVRLVDTPEFPEAYRAEALQAAEALDLLRGVHDVNWTYFSPAIVLAPSERTGRYRLGREEPVLNSAGESFISAEDYAVALLDELEQPRHERQRFTAGS
ncbi:NAD(P)-dependent oxidoreductase [Deinococcus sp. YIM 77859]|uniref:NAD(P)-dependent oxidoreductase n=1 Tax=Deinococcus sp. YIM 77859 TaxID=1540221 RepID=UPI0005538AC3|nr:NAD(P)H-binding protein [Deinococcus sp. YIM 77859]